MLGQHFLTFCELNCDEVLYNQVILGCNLAAEFSISEHF